MIAIARCHATSARLGVVVLLAAFGCSTTAAGDRDSHDAASSSRDAGASFQPSAHDASVSVVTSDAAMATPSHDAGLEPDAAAAFDASLGPDPESLVGWAAVSGDGVATTTGGAAGRVVRPTSEQELLDYAASSEPLVIELHGSFAVPRLQVSSNKTLVGIGADATIEGGLRIRGKSDAFVQNVIVRNLRVNAATSDVDGDGIQIYYAHHVWVDHCEIYDAPDGNLDIVHASSFVTVSWTRFRYSAAAPAPGHRFSNLIGHTDDNAEDVDRLAVSFHHCHWAEGVIERMPRVRYGQVHVWNSLYTAHGNNYAVGAGFEARVRLENDVFEGVNDPHVFYDGEPSAQIAASGNEYPGSTGVKDTGQGPGFTPPYAYGLEPAAEVPAKVAANAGPR